MSIQKGGRESTMASLNIRTPSAAMTRPSAAPIRASSAASKSIWPISRVRLAPSAVRIATSLLRSALRASRRLATLAQAISRTPKTPASMVYSIEEISGPMYSSV